MSRFSGKQYPGAQADAREQRRSEAEARQKEHDAKLRSTLEQFAAGATTAAAKLAAIKFPDITPAQREGNASRHTRSRRNRRSDATAQGVAANAG